MERVRALLAILAMLALLPARAQDAPRDGLVHTAPELGALGPETLLSPSLAVRPLRAGFWLYTSTREDGTPANGLIAPLPGGGALLVDTPWNDAQTETLLGWGRRAVGGIREAVVTHSHADRMGGLGALERHNIRVLANELTAAKAHAEGLRAPPGSLTAASPVLADPRGFEVFYPGPGHTLDNVVVAFPEAGIVHGGCLVKAADATSSGYVAESLLADWPLAIERVRDRYPRADLVVPGHGTIGGRAAFARTIEIAEKALAEDLAARAGRVHEDVPAAPDTKARWLFYLHGQIVEYQGRHAVSPEFGAYEYDAILNALAARGFEVVAEIRKPDAGDAYVERLVEQVGRLRRAGVPAERITVLGGSLGGYLALRAAARLSHPGLSYVLLASCGRPAVGLAPTLRGRVLSIRDEADRPDRSCEPLFAAAPGLTASREIVLHLGVSHALLYRPLPEWLDPAARWARGAGR